ncbi:bifunctional phosphoribosylaminoimidazolecarboxamide formyltransferase/IMP cyclohydrolase [Buchnera aphidicola]|uniref:Bifunctional purine biosynthesis protein PurH n=1 Tax=Buchnera aphidicola subsp. Rhopalosiphum maidis TaxID=118109 RepID=A0A3G2I5B1_BUCRM|nr:bifunctional phosphoribosylaminoimidazolecarboxamide formyltransferase/IMP cyclohydrolase [Buchnera aphidicola]AYN24469.1 bifunctional phosphoribosylaminoimidazolecarboxamide formyltransferase/IMP cyclohydrolase PurH [Buchnera aphidicola (Rhopalosiphum maidis)]
MSLNKIIKNALISLSDKTNLVEISKILSEKKINLFSTGGTAEVLKKNKIPVIEISNYTNFPEIMDGRLKTLHPKIMGGILGRKEKDYNIMKLHNLIPIDMVIVNFYPFEKIQSKKECSIEEVIDNIDIGGPTLVRAAAKNYKDVIVIVNLSDFKSVVKLIDNTISLEKRFDLATKAFKYTSLYEETIFKYFLKKNSDKEHYQNNSFPNEIQFNFIKKQDLRYGENQHQKSSFYIEKEILKSGTISSSRQLQGKNLSYNNISDADIALECVKEFSKPTCVIVKHGNPCGVAESNSLIKSYLSAYNADPISAFGGIIAFNFILDLQTTQEIIKKQFVEVIIAPEVDKMAEKILQNKQNIRLLVCGKIEKNKKGLDFKRITNGLLVQEYDFSQINIKNFSFVTNRLPTQKELEDAIFSWKVAKFVKSNAIVYSFNKTTIGIGAGQTSRIDATKLANLKVKDRNYHSTIGATMASDAFFPFRDGIDNAALCGISCIIQPGGSIRDKEVIKSANEHNISMIFTNKRHFKH